MIKEISYNGVTTTPDDYLSKDGDLAYCSDLIHEDGSIKPAPVPTSLMTIPTGYELMYIHKEHNYENWIFWTGTQLAYIKKAENGNTYINMDITTKPTQVTSIENDLVVILSTGIRHLIYKDQAYNLLPDSFPQIEQTFALVGTYNYLTYDDGIAISNDGSQYIYTDRVGSLYLYGHFWNGAISNINYTQIKKLNPSKKYPAGWYKLSVGISTITGYSCTIIRGFKTGDLSPTQIIRLDDTGVKQIKNYEYYFKLDQEVDYFDIALRASDETKLTEAMINLYQSSSKTEYVLKKDDDADSFELVNGAVRKFIQREGLDKNRFIMPFFVRTALKMVDGSYINLSAPCLMIPNSGKTPVAQPLMDGFSGDNNWSRCTLTVSALCCELQYQLRSVENFRAWKDYIKEIVIAVTPPIYQIDLNITDELEQRRKYQIVPLDTGYSVSALTLNQITPLTPDNDIYGKYSEPIIYQQYVSNQRGAYMIDLPDPKDPRAEFEKASTFYIIKRIEIDELLTNNKYSSLTTLDLGEITLNNLENYTPLIEDYSSLNSYAPNLAKAYNNRLHIADYNELKFSGYNPTDLNTYQNSNEATRIKYVAVIEFTENQSHYTVATPVTSQICRNAIRYFFYPNLYAKKATIYKISEGATWKTVLDLRQHPYMNGSYWFDDYFEPTWTTVTNSSELAKATAYLSSTTGTPALISKPNYMKISELNNALTYTDQRTYTFDSKIQALSAIVTALSTGQAGQFDLYVLTETDGVWTLKINDQGGYSNQIPVTRDTIINPKALTQLDSAILFPTARGLMMLQGSQSTCISEGLNSIQTVKINNTTFKGITALVPEASASGIEITYDFKEYIQNCQISYDYTNQRIIVHNPYYSYCYALSLRSQNWTILNHKIKYTVNSYPDAYVVDDSNHLLNLSQNDPEGEIPTGIILTRPFTMDQANEFKLIDKVRQNGYIDTDNIQQILYGSNDLRSWYICASSKKGYITDKNGSGASSFRFFRLALSVDLSEGESLDSFTAAYRIKESNDNLF